MFLSFKDNLKTRLEKYIKHWNGLVKLYRTKNRVGLIEARTIGAKKSTGDVIIILDAHCECVKACFVLFSTFLIQNRTFSTRL